MPRAIGIDLGITNSLVAFVDERNRPAVVPVEGGRPLLPSAVHYGMDGSIEVGSRARALAPEHPVDTILSVKRFMGRGPGDLRAEDRGISRFDESGVVVGVPYRVVTADYLAVIVLRVRRAKHFARILALLESGAVTRDDVGALAARHGLTDAWSRVTRRFLDDEP